MSGSVNRAILIGNVGKDPEKRETREGKSVVSFSLATSRIWRNKTTGEKAERTAWHNVVCFSEPLCKVIMEFVKKGSKVYVQGSIQPRSYEKDGEKRYVTEILLEAFDGQLVLLDKRERTAASPEDYGEPDAIPPTDSPSSEIPF